MARLIALEGIDGSGKGTQAARLSGELCRLGRSCRLWSFPRYRDSRFGQKIGEFLNGHYGALDQVHPVLVSLLFAGDRLEARPQLLESLASCDVVLCDRYVPSNIAHQAAKASGATRTELIRWIEFVEYELHALPRPDLVLWLDMPVEEAQQLIATKSKRAYTDAAADLQEADAGYLGEVRAVYAELAQSNPSWLRVACVEHGRVRTADEIAVELLQAVLYCPERGA
jgi:dTMP kinase